MYESKVFVTMVLVLIFAEVLGLYGCVRGVYPPPFSSHYFAHSMDSPQVDRGVDNEHEGDGIGMLILSYVHRLCSRILCSVVAPIRWFPVNHRSRVHMFTNQKAYGHRPGRRKV